MKRVFVLQSVVAIGLLFLVAIFASRAADRYLDVDFELGARDIATLRPETLDYLSEIKGRVCLTYFVSSRKSMPSSMRSVESAVVSILQAMQSAAPEHLDYRILDPDLDPDNGPTYAARRHRVSPVKLRRVLGDAAAEQAVWSSLVVTWDQFPDTLIQGITPQDLPYLEDLIVEHLRAMQQPVQAVVGVAAPENGFQSVGTIARQRVGARVVSINLDEDPSIPSEIDVLFWIQPTRVTREHVVELRRFLDTGRAVILAGSNYFIDTDEDGNHRLRPAAVDWNTLLRPFGLTMMQRLVLDESHAATATVGENGSIRQIDAPFQIRVLPSQYQTRSLLGNAAGALLTGETSVLLPDPRRLAAAGRQAEVVATTSERTRLMDWPTETFDNQVMAKAEPAAKQPWMVLLRPDDPWKGDLLVMGTSALYRDEIVRQGSNANAVFLRTLLRTFTDAGRLARIRVPRFEPERFPAQSLAVRVAWRGVVVFLVPLVLVALTLTRRGRWSSRRSSARWMLAGAGGWVVLVAVVFAFRDEGAWALPRLDLTHEKINTPSAVTRERLAPYRDGLTVELLISDRIHMPVSLGALESRLRTTLRGLGISFRIVRPEDLAADEQQKLRAAGITPFYMESVQHDARAAVPVWSALRLRYGDNVQVIPRLDQPSLPHVEFLLAAAVNRFDAGSGPHIGVLSDLPRLTPAEVLTDYQQKGLVAPVGSDVYSRVKSMLEQYGYRISYINPKIPVFPEGMDLLLCLQPRNSDTIIPKFSEYLAAGGKALVALQHFNVQQRQYRGARFETVYWPQPQFHRFNHYLDHLGATQVGEKRANEAGEILFDRNQGHLALVTQVNRSAFREHDTQQVARPFLIRALGSGLSSRSVVTSRLGELLFIWGSRFSLDQQQLSARGLTAEVLVSTGSRAWTYSWSGGWIPEEAFVEPSELDTFLDGPQPLAVLLQGSFPRFRTVKDEDGRSRLAPYDEPPRADQPAGELLLIGCSEMFKNPNLHAPGQQHDQFLLNAVAYLAYGGAMAELQARQPAAESFPVQTATVKAGLRGLVVALPPVLLLLYGSLRYWRRRRPVLDS